MKELIGCLKNDREYPSEKKQKTENGENCCRNDGMTGTKKRTGAKAQGQGTATAKRMGVYPE